MNIRTIQKPHVVSVPQPVRQPAQSPKAPARAELSQNEQKTLKDMFSASGENAGAYQKIGQMAERVRLGQYIDVKA
jgi:hypothetical protein